MKPRHAGLAYAVAGLGLLVTLAGCVTPAKFSPAPYSVDPNRPYRLSSNRTVTVCPAFDRLTEEARAQLSPAFNSAAYLTDAVQKELTAAGIRPALQACKRPSKTAPLAGTGVSCSPRRSTTFQTTGSYPATSSCTRDRESCSLKNGAFAWDIRRKGAGTSSHTW